MKRKVTLKSTLVITVGIIATLSAMSFGSLFFGSGLTTTTITAFDPFQDTAFPADGIMTDPYEIAYPNLDFDTPLNFNIVPLQDKIVIGQRDGKVFSFDNDDAVGVRNTVIDMSEEVGGLVWDGGFLGLAIHPQYGTGTDNDFFYVYYTSKSEDVYLEKSREFRCGLEQFHGNYLFLDRFEVNPETLKYVTGSKIAMIQREMYNTTHRGGGMEFGDDGFLYISTGDQAAYVNAQDISENLDGGVLRIDVDMIGGNTSHAPIRTLQSAGAGEAGEFSGVGYFIPNDNPFNEALGEGTVFEEYYSMGHRNPHRMTKDRATGTFYIGEVGENTHEEINVLAPGKNYGWPLFEASAPRIFTNNETGQACVTELYNNMEHQLPLVEFARAEASAIMGGYVYRGAAVPSLAGKYVCADYGIGSEIWAVDPADGSKVQWGSFTPGLPVSFGQDYAGELYVLREGDGVNLYRLIESENLSAAPRLLSQTGAFKDLQTLEVEDGFLPYDMIDSFWSDGADKKRWIAIPNDGTHDTPEEQIAFSENGVWEFPVGTIIIKHFNYQLDENDPASTKKIETRFSIKDENGIFYYLTYQWGEDEVDAILVDGGAERELNVTTATGENKVVNWHYPDTSECLTCHNEISQGTLGLRTRNLNSDYDYSQDIAGGTLGNQLVTLSQLGILDENITDGNAEGYLTHTSINDTGANIDDRARSYLDLNCAYCHQSGSESSGRSNFDLRLLNTLAQTGLLTAGYNETIDLGEGETVLFLGDKDKSQLYHRINSKSDGVMMPPLAKDQIDDPGAELIGAWIDQLTAPAAAPPVGTYRLVNTATLQTLQVATNTNARQTNVQQGGYQGFAYQNWEFEDSPNAGYYKFNATNANRYLDVAGFGSREGENVWQWEDNASDAQEWEVVDAGDGTFSIVGRRNGRFLGIEADGNAAVGINDGSDNYKWEFRPISPEENRTILTDVDVVTTSEDGTAAVVAVTLGTQPTDDVIIDITATLAEDEFTITPIQLTFTTANWNVVQEVIITGVQDEEVDAAQRFTLEMVGSITSSDEDYIGVLKVIEGTNSDDDGGGIAPPEPGTYRLVNTASRLTAEVFAANTEDEGNIQQGAYEAADHEHFQLVPQGNGLYSLIADHSDKALDVASSGLVAGSNIWQYEANGTPAQLWTVRDAGDGTYHIISELNGLYLGIGAANNIEVNNDDGSMIYRWEFLPLGTPNNAGIATTPVVLFTDEDGTTDTFEVVLEAAPTAAVNISIIVSQGTDEVSLSTAALTFTVANWNVPQVITVTGVDDTLEDGVQEYFIDVVAVAPFDDVDYEGLGTLVSGFNYDNDGGVNGVPRPGEYRLVNVGTDATIRAEDGGLINETNFTTGGYDGLDYQHFALEFVGNDLYALRALHAEDKYLDVQFSSRDAGANVWQYEGNGSPAQLWKIEEAGDGTFYIVSELSNFFLTVAVNGNVIVDANDGSDLYRWQISNTGFAPVAVVEASTFRANPDQIIDFAGLNSTDDKNDIVSYGWNFGNGLLIEEPTASFAFPESGEFAVILTVIDGDGFENTSEPLFISINEAPVGSIQASILEGFAPLEVSFSGESFTDDMVIDTFAWTFEDEATSTELNPTYTFTTSGTYSVELLVTDNEGLSTTETVKITVNNAQNTAPVAVATADVVEGNAPLEVNFIGSDSTDDAGIVSYEWNFDDNTDISNEANPVHIFNEIGTYSVTLTVADAAGLSNITTILVTTTAAENQPPVAIIAVDKILGSTPLEVNFTGSNSTDDAGIVTYNWTFGDGGTSTEANPKHTFIGIDEYTVLLIVTDAAGLENTTSIIITVVPATKTPITVANASVTEGTAPLRIQFTGEDLSGAENVTYAWDFDDDTTSRTASPSHIFTKPGTYNVVLTISNEAGVSSSETVIIIVNEAEELSFEFKLAPNPSTDFVEISFDDAIDMDEVVGVMIHDMAGRLVGQYMTADVLQGDVLRISIYDFRNEMYIVTLTFENDKLISKRLLINY